MINSLRNPIVRKQLAGTKRKIWIFTGIYSLILIIGLMFTLFLRQDTWYEDDPFYGILHFLHENCLTLVVLVWVLGTLLIMRKDYLKSIHALDVVVEATAHVVTASDNPLEFPENLKPLEVKLNELRLQTLRNIQNAAEAEQRKNDLVVYLAHDLKTPLTSVIGYLTLLHDELDISREMQDKYLQVALDKAERLEDLINEFFDITRFNLTHITLEPSQINLTRMLEQLIYEFKPMLHDKNLTCTLDAPSEYQFTCDAGKMQRVLDNLLRNAVNYSYPGTNILIKLEVGIELHLTFENQGDTIPAEKLGRIFEQFFRLDSSRNSTTGGSGVGLAIAREIVELHGGEITAYSNDHMIRFIVDLPIREKIVRNS